MDDSLHAMLVTWLHSDDAAQQQHARYRLSLPDAADRPVPAPPRRKQVGGRALAPTIDMWRIITLEDLARDTVSLCYELPPDIDLVVAVSRSGLLPGGVVAGMLHLPLWTVTARTDLVYPGHGYRMIGAGRGEPSHVLLIDDTAANGVEMRGCPEKVRAKWPGARITRCVVYCHPRVQREVDICYAIYPGMHYLLWNWQNAGHGELAGFDFDGVLCHDPPHGDRPLFLPRRSPIPLIISGRHESSRGYCEEWLARHRVRYGQMVLRDWDFDREADESTQIGTWKGDILKGTNLNLFAESDPYQSEIINRISGKAVLCPALGRVLPPRRLASDPVSPRRSCCK